VETPKGAGVRTLPASERKERATRAASFRLGHRQKESIGEYFWCDDRVPGIAFKTRQECMSAIKNKVQNDQRKEV
jgi:hypothetical protein